MGESVSEGSITGWRKRPGDFVTAGEALVDVTTDKVDVEVPAPAAGKLTRIISQEGATVSVGAALAEIDTAAKPDVGAIPKAADAPTAAGKPASGSAATSRERKDAAATGATAGKIAAGNAQPAEHQRAVFFPSAEVYTGPSPIARRRAARGAQASGDAPGSGGAVRTDAAKPAVDGKKAAATDGSQGAASTGPRPPTAAAEQVTPLRGAAASLVGHMEQSLTVPTATSFRTISVDELDAQRRSLNAALKEAGRSEKISFTHLLAFAIAQAAKTFPVMCTVFRRSAGGPERVSAGLHLGLAVDLQKGDGSRVLLVPVIRDADRLEFAEFHRRYEALVNKARAGTLGSSDMSGATMTLTNPGGIGTVASVPRLMSGQGTIVAAGAIGYPPGLGTASEDALRSMGVSKVMTLTSTYDHRVIQGAESGEFLRRIEQLIGGADDFYGSVFASLGLKPTQAPPVGRRFEQRADTSAAQASAGSIGDITRAAAAAMALITRYRTHGINAANLDPLSDRPSPDPALDPATLSLDEGTMAQLPANALRVYAPGSTLREVVAQLKDTYCSTIAYEVEHMSNHEQRSWLRQQIESNAQRRSFSRERKLELLERLTRVESFERYLRKAFLGQKTFSIEGLDAMVPMLEEMLVMLAEDGTFDVRIGMAHRGRLAVITHVVDRPYEEILFEFEQAQLRGLIHREGDVTGDVKYHQGATGTYTTPSGQRVTVVLANNPSHLEAVDSVVEGQTRALQTDRKTPIAGLDPSKAAAILIHGDAAFNGQGTVAEVFNLQSLAGYTTGGTLHLIANNQLGFTTLPKAGRSTRYASDLAKGFDVPIVHVNADDLEACIAAVDLAVAYRRRFHRDALIDLVGYRRFGHNEADEPAYTQPLMYARIADHPTARELFARRLIEEGTVSEAEVKESEERATSRVAQAHESVKAHGTQWQMPETPQPAELPAATAVNTRVPADMLRRLNQHLTRVPDGFAVHPKLLRQFERRKDALDRQGEIDWGLGEALAFASLLDEGVPIRLTGQDTERGTFSHRHLVLHDVNTGATWTPLQHLADAHASFEIYNSPLSEYACMGFEYGYSATAPEALVLWEAQFGDFNNGGQIIIDQFIAAGRAKWDERSRLTLLLPHGYEGAGPEHSSARLERFLQLAAEGNFRVANCTTPGQYFHLLRDQAKASKARPLVIMTPKSLLRLRAAGSAIGDLTDAVFVPVLDDPSLVDRQRISRLNLCSGKIYYDLTANPKRSAAADLAIARVELLEPFPFDDVLSLVASYPNVRSVTWVQEEPKNMGARAFVSRRLRERLIPKGIAFGYVGRPDRASPSEGYPGAHAAEQERIVREALGLEAT